MNSEMAYCLPCNYLKKHNISWLRTHSFNPSTAICFSQIVSPKTLFVPTQWSSIEKLFPKCREPTDLLFKPKDFPSLNNII